MPDLLPFQFDTTNVRIHLDENDKPWWVLTDICSILGIANPSQASSRLKPEESMTICFTYTEQVELKLLLVNEKGLYRLIFRSNRPEAQRFQDWVFGEVLPQIRQRGSYHSPAKSSGDMLVEMAIAYREQEHRLQQIERQQQVTQQALLSQQETIIQTQDMALTALRSMQWVTIRQYVEIYQLQHQAPPSIQRAFATWLTTHCQERGHAMYKSATADKQWPYEKTYCIAVIHDTFRTWLTRRISPPLPQGEAE